jgi:hypothetical protein
VLPGQPGSQPARPATGAATVFSTGALHLPTARHSSRHHTCKPNINHTCTTHANQSSCRSPARPHLDVQLHDGGPRLPPQERARDGAQRPRAVARRHHAHAPRAARPLQRAAQQQVHRLRRRARWAERAAEGAGGVRRRERSGRASRAAREGARGRPVASWPVRWLATTRHSRRRFDPACGGWRGGATALRASVWVTFRPVARSPVAGPSQRRPRPPRCPRPRRCWRRRGPPLP